MQDDIVLGGQKSKFSWKIFGLVMMAVAVLGLIFGVVMILVKNDEVARVKAAYEASGMPTGTGDERGNPVVKAEPPAAYTMSANSALFESGKKGTYLSLKVQDGAITECKVRVIGSASESSAAGDCQINGVEGKIYKVAQLNYSDTEKSETALGLIMADGTVAYVPLSGTEGNAYNVKGKLPIDGVVVDAMGVEVKPNEYVEGTFLGTLFVLRTGEIRKFDVAMLESM